MSITSLPSAPQPTDSTSEFNTKAFAWVAALDTWTTEANALGVQVSDDSDTAAAAAVTASAASDVAVAAANAVAWVSGTTYETGDVVWSPSNFQTYRRKTDGAGTTDPSSDSTNWQVISGDVSTTGEQTLTNKTLTSPVINTPVINTPLITAGKETKVAIAASDINLTLGNYYSKTISATTTFTVSNVPATGTVASFILDLTNGGSATINWWSGVKWAGGTAPTLTASGRDALGFYTYDAGTTWTGLLLGKGVK